MDHGALAGSARSRLPAAAEAGGRARLRRKRGAEGASTMDKINERPPGNAWRLSLRRWVDNGESTAHGMGEAAPGRRIDWPRVIPFIGMHLACGAVIYVGVSATALCVAAGLY